MRRYYFPGVTHGGGRGGFQWIEPGSAGRICALPENPNSTAESMRALRKALTDWVVKDVAPPESRYPTIARGELVAPMHTAMGFPAIPGTPLPDNMINVLPIYDFGPAFRYNDLSGAISTNRRRFAGRFRCSSPRQTPMATRLAEIRFRFA